MKNTLKEKLSAGKCAFGTWQMTNSADVSEILAHAGSDCIMIDGEHGSMDIETAGRLVTTIKTTGTVPLLRIPWNDMAMVKRGLDTGAYGIMIPMVNSKEEAERAVSYCKYPPVGVRGMGLGRAMLWGGGIGEYFPSANQELLTIIQIEHYKAVEAIDEILSVPGIDIAFVGPGDLGMSMGVAMDSPKLDDSFKKVITACKKNNIVQGILTWTGGIKKQLDMGFRFFLGGVDGQILFAGAKQITDEFQRVADI
jgi:2-keto-3-deoxy-L-rhamnonate aldolase RhmA